MTYTIEKSVQATRDIEEAFVYIAEQNLDAAVRFLVAIEDSLLTPEKQETVATMLKDNPDPDFTKIGHVVGASPRTIRRFAARE